MKSLLEERLLLSPSAYSCPVAIISFICLQTETPRDSRFLRCSSKLTSNSFFIIGQPAMDNFFRAENVPGGSGAALSPLKMSHKLHNLPSARD